MLEARDYSNVDILLLFLDSIIHPYCGPSETITVTGGLTRCTSILNMLYCRNLYSGWLDEELETLCNTVRISENYV